VKKVKAAHHENHERWLVSYADFITLLFAFFVVMFATAQQDQTKAREVAESVREALKHGQLSQAIADIINHNKTMHGGKGISRDRTQPTPVPPDSKPAPATHADLVKSKEALQKALDKELNSGKVSVVLDGRGLVISLREAAFFASGDDTVNQASYPIIAKLSEVILNLSNPLRLEGHTDSVPIHTARFPSNWDLSTARAIGMLELLRDQYRVPVERMSVAGFAENAPVDTNSTEEGRAHNRRVDLVVLSAEAMNGEPPASPARK
jgi:chemotaxis protein MotB